MSQQTVFLTPPRFVALPRGEARVRVRLRTPTEAVCTFRSSAFLHAVALDVESHEFQANDNFFDLYPGEAKEVTLVLKRATTRREVLRALRWQSLVDTYD
jgi:beta-mannosidase